MSIRTRLVLAFALILPLAAPAAIEPGEVPPELRGWIDWVRKDAEHRVCPLLLSADPEQESAWACVWPSALEIDAGADGARFEQRLVVYARSAVPLPGDSENWPQEVTGNGLALAVVAGENESPVVWLEAGSHALAGRFRWQERPEALTVPESTALIELELDGTRVFPLERSDGQVWLGSRSGAVREADSLELTVFRMLIDGVPATLSTRIELDIAGEGREETLGRPLPEGFVPTALHGDLPARLDGDGALRIQARPGNYILTLQARATAPLTTVARPAPGESWPAQEIWAYAPNPRLRVTSAGGAPTIDPAQSGVPEGWGNFQAFLLEGESALTVEERSRGLSEQEQNRLTLARELWLDFDGSGWTTRDRINGSMVRDWRLDLAPPYLLTRASADGEGLLVTRGTEAGSTGIELREHQVALEASARIDSSSARMPITGWQQAFEGVNVTLNLPPAWRLVAALGVDAAPESWVMRWNLLDVFLVAITTLMAFWLGRVPLAALTLGYLVLGYQEPDTPVIAVLIVLALGLVLKVLPDNRFAQVLRWVRIAALGLLALLAVLFGAAQVRLALYPQLERPDVSLGYGTLAADGMVGVQFNQPAQPDMPAAQPAPMSPAISVDRAQSEELERITVVGSRIKRTDLLQRYAANTQVQAGKGDPGWSWGRYGLSWSGPVLADQDMRLVLLPPWLTRPLRVLVVALLGLLLWQLGRASFSGGLRLRSLATPGAAVALLLPLAALAQSTPDEKLLEQLRARVLEAPECAPRCARIARASVSAAGDSLRIALEVHAAERSAVPLPSAGNLVRVGALRIDGIEETQALRSAQGETHIVVGRGVRRVELSLRAAAAPKIVLRFPAPPATLEFEGTDWEAGGLTEGRLLTDTLELVRVRRADSAADTSVAQQYPPFVIVTRAISFDLDWRVDTTVRRVAPGEGGFSVVLPLLAGERVTTAGLRVSEGRIEVPLPAGAGEASWSSQLDKGETLLMTAPELSGHAEVWELVASPTWNLAYIGVPATAPADYSDWAHEFHPLPGERLEIAIRRPEAVAGATLAIDDVSLHTSVGKRARESTLALTLRSTQGGQHSIGLPEQAEVLGINIDGSALNLQPQQGRLALPVRPGSSRVEVRWRENEAIGFRSPSAAVDLGTQAANLRLGIGLPQDRWLLGARGPRVGPAILYWSALALLVLIAWGLSRTRRTPLGFRDWLLLGLGFSTFSWFAFALVVVWLFALDWRGRDPAPESAIWFDLRQIALVALSAIALFALLAAVPQGLLSQPDMQVAGNGSSAYSLAWFDDQTDAVLPSARAYSVSLWWYKAAMLAWALWLANALMRWLRWGWDALGSGAWWRAVPRRTPAPVSRTKPTDTSTPPV
jgi:hypothetical protein